MLIKNRQNTKISKFFAFKTFFAVSFLVIFIFSIFFANFHSFGHNFSKNFSKIEKIDGFFEKNQENHNIFNCSFCLSNNFHNNSFLALKITFSAMLFYMAFARRYFSSVKLSYLLNSFSSRAPPALR